MVNFWTKAPEPSQINLWVGGGQPGEKGTTEFGTYSTNSDGSFDIKSNAEWNGTEYKLLFIPNDGSGSFINYYSINKHQTLNIGNVLAGNVNITCKVILDPVSGASIHFLGIEGTPTYSAGTYTVFTASSVYLSQDYQTIGNFYPVTYSLSTGAAATTIMVPLNPPSDSCSVTIHY